MKKVIQEICPNERIPKYSIEYYIEYIYMVLNDLKSWSSLKRCNLTRCNHHKTINKKHIEWSKMGVYEEVFNRIIKEKYLINIMRKKYIDLFIDTTNISNKFGVEGIAYGEYKKKKQSKISIICDVKANILALNIFSGNIHDSNTIIDTINKLDISKYRKINLIGDKGYIKDDKFKSNLLKNYNTKLIHPQRKNQKKKTNKNTKKKLSNRYIVEHSIQKIKNFNRLVVRRDKLCVTFKGFIYLAISSLFFNKVK